MGETNSKNRGERGYLRDIKKRNFRFKTGTRAHGQLKMRSVSASGVSGLP